MDDLLCNHQLAQALAQVGLQSVRLEDLERAAVKNALAAYDGCRRPAARSLGISVRTLQRKLKAWGLQPKVRLEITVR